MYRLRRHECRFGGALALTETDRTQQSIETDNAVTSEPGQPLLRQVEAIESRRPTASDVPVLSTDDGQGRIRPAESDDRSVQEPPDLSGVETAEPAKPTPVTLSGVEVAQVPATTAGLLRPAFGEGVEFGSFGGDDGQMSKFQLENNGQEVTSGDVQTLDPVTTNGSNSGDDAAQSGNEHLSQSTGTELANAGSDARVGASHDASFTTHLRRADASPLPNQPSSMIDGPGRPFETGSLSVRLDLAQADGEPLQVHVSVVHQTVYARVVTSQTEVQDFLTRNQGRLEASLEQHGLEVGQFLVDSGPHHDRRSSQEWNSQALGRSGAGQERTRVESEISAVPSGLSNSRYRLNLVI